MPHVFISYVRENTEEVQRLCDELTRHGVKVWLDLDKIKPGHRWKDAIRDAIRQGDFFIACFSKAYDDLGRTYMNEELTRAIEELRQRPTDRAWFIPVLVSECEVPDRKISEGETLQDIQWVELYEDWDAGIQRILEVVSPYRTLLNNLDHADKRVRNDAINQLKSYGQAAMPALRDALTDRHQSTTLRQRIAFVLGQMGKLPLSAVSDLIKIVEDRNDAEDVRREAAWTLGEIGEPIAVFPLIHTLYGASCPNQVSLSIRKSLQQIGTPDALKAVETYENKLKDGK